VTFLVNFQILILQKLLKLFNIPAKSVSERKDLKEAIAEMMVHEGPYFLEVIVEKINNVFPMIPSGKAVSEMLLEDPSKEMVH
jgi:acetolactate synthase-1/2/3 large subunit